MTPIQEIREALAFYDANNTGGGLKILMPSADYIRTLLEEIDTKSTEISSELVARATKAEQERDALRAEVERLNKIVDQYIHKTGADIITQVNEVIKQIEAERIKYRFNSSGVDPLLNKPITTSP